VRHSKATSVRITLDATGIEIVDDGSGGGRKASGELATHSAGHGLEGLTERVVALGGQLVAGPVHENGTAGFRLRVDVPV